MLYGLTARLRCSVRERLLLGGVSMLAPITLIFGAWGIENQRVVLLETIDRQGRSLVGATAIFSVEPLLASDYPVLDTYVNTLTNEKESVLYARIEDRRGRVVAEAGGRAATEFATTEYSYPVTVPGDTDADAEPIGKVVLGLSTEPAKQALADSRRLQLIETCAGFLILVLSLSWLHNRLVGRPLSQLDADAKRLARADLSQPIQLKSEDEFGRLARALEDMRIGLQASYAEIQEQNESLLELDRLKSEFLATVSHEIRTPMNGVMGFANELLDTDLSDRQREMLLLVLSSAEGLLFILNDILDFSKIDAGKMDLEQIAFDFERLVGNVVKLSGPDAKAGGIDLSVRGAETVPAVVGDPHRIRQVVTNLVTNAIKFSQGGTVQVRVSVVERTAHSMVVRTCVRDTGIGIPEDRLSTLFEPFRQVDGSHTRKYGGSGLGLSICQGILQLMDSQLHVQSVADKGSEFWFDLRLVLADESAKLVETSPEPTEIGRPLNAGDEPPETISSVSDVPSEEVPRGASVLLAEDNPTNQKLIQTVLTRIGVEVAVADNGRIAVETYLADPGRFDLVLMDCQMPELDGIEATRQIREKGANSHRVPIVALTANTDDEVRAQCAEAGMDDFLTKPLLLEDLRAALAKWAPVSP